MTTTEVSTLDSVLRVGKWLIENSAAIGNQFAVWTNGVTNVRQWVNESTQPIEVMKDDGRGIEDHYTIPPGRTVSAEMWIPWVVRASDYPRHHATFRVNGRPFAYVWQSGRVIRFNVQDAYVGGGIPVPGLAVSGGDRRCTFGSDPTGSVGFVLSGTQ